MGKFAGIILAFINTLGSANAGVGSSGGGYAVQCFDSQTGEEYVSFLDLFESEMTGGVVLPPIGGLGAEYKRVLKVLRTTLLDTREPSDADAARFRRNLASFKFVTHELDWVGDLGPTSPIPAECSIKQLAVYHSDHTVEVNQPLFDKLQPRDQVALYVHEIIYREYRRFTLPSSAGIRALVAKIYAEDKPLLPVNANLNPNAQECIAKIPRQGPEARFYLQAPSANPRVRDVRIHKLKGLDLLLPIDVSFNLDEFANIRRVPAGPLSENSVTVDFDQEGNPRSLTFIPKNWHEQPLIFMIDFCQPI